ncbi:MAG: nitrilase-related carbon-nitrogen hydrolase, partial [Rhodospirillaceae bacterium]
MAIVAIVQKPPVLLDRARTIESVLAILEEVAQAGAALAVFPEAHIPGYPSWIWRLRPEADLKLTNEIHARLRENAIDLERDGLADIREAAARHKITVVIGFHEIDSNYSGTTLFNSLAVIGPDGAILNRHRKLIP